MKNLVFVIVLAIMVIGCGPKNETVDTLPIADVVEVFADVIPDAIILTETSIDDTVTVDTPVAMDVPAIVDTIAIVDTGYCAGYMMPIENDASICVSE
jgi:hypothetical protein